MGQVKKFGDPCPFIISLLFTFSPECDSFSLSSGLPASIHQIRANEREITFACRKVFLTPWLSFMISFLREPKLILKIGCRIP